MIIESSMSTVDANIDEEELESLLENQTTSLFVGNVRN